MPRFWFGGFEGHCADSEVPIGLGRRLAKVPAEHRIHERDFNSHSSSRLPLALRTAPALPAAPADLDELLATLLAPARTGFVIVRDDLERAAADLGLGLRAGERRFALRALLGQAPAAVLGWLAAEARSQAGSFVTLPAITGWWTARAHVGATWLDELAALAGDRAPEHKATRVSERPR